MNSVINSEKQLVTIEDVKEQFEIVKSYVGTLEFSEMDESVFKKEVAKANKIVKDIDRFRIDRTNEHLKMIEQEVNTLTTFTKDLKTIIKDVSTDYQDYLKELELEKETEIELMFNLMLNDFENLKEVVTLDMIWDNKYLNKTYKIKDVEANISLKLNDFAKLLNAVEDKELLIKVKFDLEKYSDIRELTKVEKDDIVEEVDTTYMTIKLKRSYLTFLKSMNVEFEEVK